MDLLLKMLNRSRNLLVLICMPVIILVALFVVFPDKKLQWVPQYIVSIAKLSTHNRTKNRLQKLSRRPVFPDLNCVYTIPENLLGGSDMPVMIPESLDLSKDILACLYHRYITTRQTLCVEPKLMGRADKNGGYVCVDNDSLPYGKCNVYIFGNAVDQHYIRQLRRQYKCNVEKSNGKNLTNDLKPWIQTHKMTDKIIHALVLTIGNNTEDLTVTDELLKSTKLLSQIRQISIKIFFDPRSATSSGYKERLLLFQKLYKLNFRIFFFNQEFRCTPKSTKVTKFLSCYSVFLMRPASIQTSYITIPNERQIWTLTKNEQKKLYDKYLYSIQIMCRQILRIGKITDGGWNVCHDTLYRPKPYCLVYSFGINFDFSFDEDVIQTYGCEVFSFDPSMRTKDYQYSVKGTFLNLGISGKDEVSKKSWKLRRLNSIINMLNHTDRVIDILKMDVEGAEWEALNAALYTNVFDKVRQLCVEFHNMPNAKKLLILKRLYNYGFRIFWGHKNLVCGYSFNGGFATTCNEVYFLNTKFKDKG